MNGLFEDDENVRHIKKPRQPKPESKKSPKPKKVQDVGRKISARMDLTHGAKAGFDFGEVDINPAAKPKKVKKEDGIIEPPINYVE